MKRALLVCYVFPPDPFTGANRAGYLARYLPQHGWDVTVLTHCSLPPPFDARVVSAGSQKNLIDYLPFRIRDRLLIPDISATWIPSALASGRDLLRRERFDAIISTAHPPSVHVVASLLARMSGLPWIADYRDPWAGNYLRRGALRTKIEGALERYLLRYASSLTTVNDVISEQLRKFHNRQDVFTIPNGYDPNDWSGIEDTGVARFDLCHTGRIYETRYHPEVLFEALSQLRAEGDPAGVAANLHFFGPESNLVNTQALRFGISDIVFQHGLVSRADAMRAQRRSAGLLIFQPMDAATRNEMGSKYLEYLGARRRIVAIGPSGGAMQRFLDNHDLGWFATNPQEAKTALRALYAHYVDGKYMVETDTNGIMNAQDLAARFAGRLNAAAENLATDAEQPPAESYRHSGVRNTR